MAKVFCGCLGWVIPQHFMNHNIPQEQEGNTVGTLLVVYLEKFASSMLHCSAVPGIRDHRISGYLHSVDRREHGNPCYNRIVVLLV